MRAGDGACGIDEERDDRAMRGHDLERLEHRVAACYVKEHRFRVHGLGLWLRIRHATQVQSLCGVCGSSSYLNNSRMQRHMIQDAHCESGFQQGLRPFLKMMHLQLANIVASLLAK